jgi:glycosyltransferase involved in cell wall biosynthesis
MTVVNAPDAARAPWLLISGGFHDRGGQDKAASALADYLLARGHALHLVSHEIAEHYRGHSAVTVHEVARPLGSCFLGDMALSRRGRRVARDLALRSPASRVVACGGNCPWHDINWVHSVHHAWPCCDAGAPLWFRVKNRLTKGVCRWRERRAIRSARLIITNSERTRRDVQRCLGLDGERIHAVPLGTDPAWMPAERSERDSARDELKLPAETPVVLFVGALSHDHNKGLDTLLAAWQSLCANPDWDAVLLVAGAGNALGAWQARVARSPIAGRVRWLGYTDRIFDLLAAADLLVSPVRYEAYGLNVQEALCRGVPAMVTATAGVAERYPPELADLLLTDPNDVGNLIQKLRHWRPRRDEWRRRVLPLSASLRGYTWEMMAGRLVALAEEFAPAP